MLPLLTMLLGTWSVVVSRENMHLYCEPSKRDSITSSKRNHDFVNMAPFLDYVAALRKMETLWIVSV